MNKVYSKKELNLMCRTFDNLYDILRLDLSKKETESLKNAKDVLLLIAQRQNKDFITSDKSPNTFKVVDYDNTGLGGLF